MGGLGVAQSRIICTVVSDTDTGELLLSEGDCATRVTPASTFKVVLAVIGFDAGILKSPAEPVMNFKQGYPDWGTNWKQPTSPADWMRYSVLWYSQEIARELGRPAFERYMRDFGYGNADVSGDPGKNNSLERSWLSSSLKISPLEQTEFLRRLVNGDLPVATNAIAMTKRIVEAGSPADGWEIRGKTGSAYPRLLNGKLDRQRSWGWYVGWAEKGGRRVTFARLTQDEGGEEGPAGLRARKAFLAEWPDLARRAFRQ